MRLLPNVLAKQAAREAGAYEAWFVDDDGLVTEGASTNAWIVAADGALRTRQAERASCAASRARRLLDVVAAEGLRLAERPFSRDEAFGAREAFITGATTLVMPVVAIDGRQIGDGRPGRYAGAAAQVRRLRGAQSKVAPARAPRDGGSPPK